MLISPQLLSNEEIKTYVKKALQFGLDTDKIKSNLRVAGFRKEEIDRSFQDFEKEQVVPLPPSPSSSLPSQPPSQNPYSPPPTQPPPITLVTPPSNSQRFTFQPYPTTNQTRPAWLNEKSFFPFLTLAYYENILIGARKISVFFIFFLIALVNSLKPVYTVITTGYPIATKFTEKAKEIINEVYPAELEVKIKNGQVNSNVSEPYYVSIPKDVLNILQPSKKGKKVSSSRIRFLTIDTKGKKENFEKYQSYILLTNDSLVYYTDDKVKTESLKNIKDLTINKQIVNSKLEEINKNFPIDSLLKIALLLIPLLIIFSLLLFQLIDNLFTSLLVLLIIKIKQQSFSFSKIFTCTAAVSFIPTVFLGIVSGFSSSKYLVPFESFSMVIIIGIIYSVVDDLSKTTDV